MTDTHTEILLNEKKLTPVAPHVILGFLVVTSPTRDVSTIIWTDCTYDSELGIAEDLPNSAPVTKGEHMP